MASKVTVAHEMIGRVVSDLTQLPEEDLSLVVEFVDYLKQQRQVISAQHISPAQIRAAARRRASRLAKVPRTEIAARFQELAEEIRHEVIGKEAALEGDWPGD